MPDLRESRREAARQLGVEANRVLHFVPYKGKCGDGWLGCVRIYVCWGGGCGCTSLTDLRIPTN